MVEKKIRIDKYLSDMGKGTRGEVRKMIKAGRVSLNGNVFKSPGENVSPISDKLFLDGVEIKYQKFIYLMMNKPAGYISATYDPKFETVIELLKEPYSKMELFPAGRLDKDSVGFLLLTNDGQFAHQVISPKKNVEKEYYVKVHGKLADEHTKIFERGIEIEKGELSRPSVLKILESGESSTAHVVLTEGKFHQVKRMFEKIDMKVIYLKRIRIGNLFLDENLKEGEVKEIDSKDIFE